MSDYGNGRVRSHPPAAIGLGPLAYPGRLLLYCGKKGALVRLIAIAVGAAAPVQIGAFKFWVATALDRRDGSVDPPA